jgi:hypothetical protein
MTTARSTTNTISVNHKISQTVLHAAQITAVAFLTLVLVVGLQAAASATDWASGGGHASGPGHFELMPDDCQTEFYDVRAGKWEACAPNNQFVWIPDSEPFDVVDQCEALLSACMGDGWLSAWLDLDRERVINRQYDFPSIAEWAAAWENVDFASLPPAPTVDYTDAGMVATCEALLPACVPGMPALRPPLGD